jgi:hypothetical protein
MMTEAINLTEKLAQFSEHMGTPTYTVMRERDQQRHLRAAAILSTLTAPAAADLYHAALLFQHPT